MNKNELIAQVATQTGLTKKDVDLCLAAAIHQVTQALLQQEKVQLAGFGTFEVKDRAQRMGQNPKTKEKILIPATKIPTFKPGKALKDAVADLK